MNDSKNSSNGLLVLRYQQAMTKEQIEYLTQAIEPTAKWLGVEPLVLSDGADAKLEMGHSALLERVCAALEEIAAQGRAPEVSEAQIAPQALNARPTGLNSRPVYDGTKGNGYQPTVTHGAEGTACPPKER